MLDVSLMFCILRIIFFGALFFSRSFLRDRSFSFFPFGFMVFMIKVVIAGIKVKAAEGIIFI